MDLLKKHYEKVILGVVLIGLAVAVGFLPFMVASEKEALASTSERLNPKAKELTNLNLTVSENALKRVASGATVDFGDPNRLFNPMPWQKSADDRLIPYSKVGPAAATVTNLVPLYFRLTLDSVTTTDSGPRYVIGVQREAAVNARDRAKRQTYASLNSKTDHFVIIEVKGKPEDPDQLVLILNDSDERVTISRDKPYERIDSYMADFRYDPERKSWTTRRVGAVLAFAGEEYNIVAINRDEVVLSAKSNGKKWTIKTNSNAS